MLINDHDEASARGARIARWKDSVATKLRVVGQTIARYYQNAATFMELLKIAIVPSAFLLFAFGVARALITHEPLSKPVGLIFSFALGLSIVFDAGRWANVWHRVIKVARILYPCLFAVLSVIVVDSVLVANYQGRELLRRLAEEANRREIISFFCISGLWFLEIWYVCRVMLLFRFRGTQEEEKERDDLLETIKFMPRVTSFIACTGLAGAMYVASRSYATRDAYTMEAKARLLIFASMVMLIGALILTFISLRRRLKFVENDPWRKSRASLEEVGLVTRLLLIAIGIASIVLVIAIDRWPMEVSMTMGPLGVVLTAAVCWVALSTAALYYGLRHHVPIFTLAIAALVGFSYFNDNHQVRSTNKTPRRPTIEAAFNRWAAARLAANPNPRSRIPVFIVAAEGGGIRAAYWTGSVLGHLQHIQPTFAENTFAISGVSGGSLGATTFVATIADPVARDRVSEKTRAMLSQDFLAPLLGRMLFSDLIQQFVPVPVVRDRARGIEEAWERSWSSNAIAFGKTDAKLAKPDLFARPFCTLWQQSPDAAVKIPNLFLNGTVVETGRRAVVSNLDVSDSLDDAEDALEMTGGEPRVSAAVHLSARFTYVSPAGLIRPYGKPRGAWRHIVDGGYFENSGCTTASEILELVKRQIDGNAEWRDRFIPIVILINHETTRLERDGNAETFLGEFFSPVRAMLKTREAHAVTATEEIVGRIGAMNGWAIVYQLPHLPVPAPLGWSLSTLVAHEIDDCFNAISSATCAQKTMASDGNFRSAFERPVGIISHP
jgi:hypothetical protein